MKYGCICKDYNTQLDQQEPRSRRKDSCKMTREEAKFWNCIMPYFLALLEFNLGFVRWRFGGGVYIYFKPICFTTTTTKYLPQNVKDEVRKSSQRGATVKTVSADRFSPILERQFCIPMKLISERSLPRIEDGDSYFSLATRIAQIGGVMIKLWCLKDGQKIRKSWKSWQLVFCQGNFVAEFGNYFNEFCWIFLHGV